jgi:hypothetical protein
MRLLSRGSPFGVAALVAGLAGLAPFAARAQDAAVDDSGFSVRFESGDADRLKLLGHAECLGGVLTEQVKLAVEVTRPENTSGDYRAVLLVKPDDGAGCEAADAELCADEERTDDPDRCRCVARGAQNDSGFEVSRPFGSLLFGTEWSGDGLSGCSATPSDRTYTFVPAFVPADATKSAQGGPPGDGQAFKQTDAGVEDASTTTPTADVVLGTSTAEVQIDEVAPSAAGAVFVESGDRALVVSVADDDVPAGHNIYACARAYGADGSAPTLPAPVAGNALFYSTTQGKPEGVEPDDLCARSSTDGATARIEAIRPGASYGVFVFVEDEAGNFGQPASTSRAQSAEYLNFAEYYRTAGGREKGGCQGLPGSSGPMGLVAVGIAAGIWVRRRRGGRS